MDGVLGSLLFSGAFNAEFRKIVLATPMFIYPAVAAEATLTVPAWGKAGASVFFCVVKLGKGLETWRGHGARESWVT